MLLLADLEGMSLDDLKDHIAGSYEAEKNLIDEFNFLIAYESVGAYGCDSQSWFLMSHKETGKLFENNGSHCSCYGFEGQFEPEETSISALKHRNHLFYGGGYDLEEKENHRKAVKYLDDLTRIIKNEKTT